MPRSQELNQDSGPDRLSFIRLLIHSLIHSGSELLLGPVIRHTVVLTLCWPWRSTHAPGFHDPHGLSTPTQPRVLCRTFPRMVQVGCLGLDG